MIEELLYLFQLYRYSNSSTHLFYQYSMRNKQIQYGCCTLAATEQTQLRVMNLLKREKQK
jgi:hypothetical protein